MTRARRTRLLAAILTAGLRLAACSEDETSSGLASTTAATADEYGMVGGDSHAVTDELTTAVPDGTVPDPPSDLTLPVSPEVAPPPAASSAHTSPGAYTYAVTGEVNGETVLGVSTLIVSDLGPNGSQTHIEETAGGTTSTVYRVTGEGRHLESVMIDTGGRQLELQAEEPFLLVPSGARGGDTTSGRLFGDDAVATVTYTLVELDAERMIHQIVTRLAARIGGTCMLTGTVSVTAAVRTADQLPLDIRAESDMEMSGNEACAGLTSSRTRSLLKS